MSEGSKKNLNIDNKIEKQSFLNNKSDSKESNLNSNAVEKVQDMSDSSNKKSIEYLTKAVQGSITQSSQQELSQNPKREKEISDVLEKNLKEDFLSMDEKRQEKFKKVGEETSRKINKLMEGAKINVKKIIKLIKEWLSIIPGVNKIFLEQSAKIKADEIMELRKNNEYS